MSGRGTPPAVDDGDTRSLTHTLWRELAPTPGRLGNTTRLVALVLVTVTIGEVFRLPDMTVPACLALFVSGTEGGTAVTTSLLATGALLVGTLLTIVMFMVSLSEPALRIPLIALLTFAAGFLMRASPLGPAFQLFGFWIVYSTTQGDELMLVARQPDTITNTTDPATMNQDFIPPSQSATGSMPDSAFFPPEEALLHTILWLAFVFIMALVLIAIANWLTGRDPAQILRVALADRLAAAAAFCEGGPDSREKLAGLAKEGSAKLYKLHKLSGMLHRNPRKQEIGEQLIRESARLGLALLAWSRVAPDAARSPLRNVARTCRRAECAVRNSAKLQGGAPPAKIAPRTKTDLPNAAIPLLSDLRRVMRSIGESLSDQSENAPADVPKPSKEPQGLFAPDAFNNPDYVHFGLKLMLAVMICYFIERFTNWPGIHTIMVTCFFVSLETVGQTVHKMTMRIGGCLVGATFGFATILFLMPIMNNIGDFLLVMTPVMVLACWVQSGSERISYVGPQIALAYFVCVLQGFGPTIDMENGRNRVVGIILGIVVDYVVFTTFWPVSVADKVRQGAGAALERLADLLVLRRTDTAKTFDAEEEKLRKDFAKAIAQAREIMVNDPYEPDRIRPDRGRRPIDASVLTQLQALIVPVSVILGHRPAPAWRNEVPDASRDIIQAHHSAMSDWLRRCAAWVRTGEGAAGLQASLPKPPDLDVPAAPHTDPARKDAVARHLAARAVWYGVLHQDIRTILDEIGSDAELAALPTRDAALVSA